MNERLLQFIWQFQYFDKHELTSRAGEPLQIIFPGTHNSNQGPDFLNAKIRVGKATWAGHIELHLAASGWKKHKHDTDKNYSNVILHVVWEDDTPQDGALNIHPVLELKGRISRILLQRYESLMTGAAFIPCEKMISHVRPITWQSWKDRLLAERMIRKGKAAEVFLQQNNYHWEETFWWMLARNFGMKVNADAFETMAQSIPVTVLAKHKTQIHQLEALLLGQAGLLEGAYEDEYPKLLQREYKFLKGKYSLAPIHHAVHFLRMRPGNFPTLRLAQLAALVQNSAHLFSKIKEAGSVKQLKALFNVTANDYWHYHYRFDKASSYKRKELGESMTDNIIINTVCPVIFAYGSYHSEERYKEKALQWLEQVAAEDNSITKGFAGLGIANKSAFDSQALIELKNEYCNKMRCLDCGVGNAILKNGNR